MRFEGPAIRWPGGIKRRTVSGARVYTLQMDVPNYEPRQVRITFANWSRVPLVTVDGPTDSPHRYGKHGLCMWYPDDPPEQRWVFADGLLELLNVIQRHLFYEAWWRETDEWLGEEAPHSREAKRPERDEGRREDAA